MEQWKDIPGYVGLYQASDEGRVRSLVRLLARAVERGERKEKRVLKPGKDGNGRLHVALSRGGVARHYQVHRLVLQAFVGECPVGMECCHGDGDPLNNALGNLRWGTREENREDQRKHGIRFGTPMKLTAEQVESIRGEVGSQREIGKKYGVSGVTIHAIRSGKTWKQGKV